MGAQRIPLGGGHLESAGPEDRPGKGLQPEAMFISALIDTGKYIPGAYGIRSEQFFSNKPIHNWCMKYQEQEGKAPHPSLLKSKYPSFPYTPNIGPTWAASQMSEAYTNRTLINAMHEATNFLNDDVNDEAIATLKRALLAATPAVGGGVDAYDVEELMVDQDLVMCPVPAGQLRQTTQGIGAGDLWIVAARLGIGKSWRLIQHAVAAAEGGWDVAYFSLEMPAKSVLDRIHRVALSSWKNPWGEMDMKTRRDLLEKWAVGKGAIQVYDPSSGRCDASVISSMAGDNTLVVVDYVGLMHTTTGTRAIEDWRAMAMISNQLKEVALERNVPIVAAAQLNREASRSNGAPGAEHLAQSDALGQDADAVITLKKHSKRVLFNSLTKYRHGESGVRWYTRFEPGFGRFEDLSVEKAHTLKTEDDAIEDNYA